MTKILIISWPNCIKILTETGKTSFMRQVQLSYQRQCRRNDNITSELRLKYLKENMGKLNLAINLKDNTRRSGCISYQNCKVVFRFKNLSMQITMLALKDERSYDYLNRIRDSI